jgi:hypothetical protein
MAQFRWTRKREKAALALAQGYTCEEAAEIAGVARRTIHRWKNNLDFAAEIDRLTLLVGISSRGERLRICMRVVRERLSGEKIDTAKDLLDWLKFVQSETDGAKFDLASIFEALEAEATGGDGPGQERDGTPAETGGDREAEGSNPAGE